jgi:hypothetical protein
LVGFGATWNFWISSERPISMALSRPPRPSSVRWARLTRGVRKVGTALAMASTPVSAEQLEAKARSSRSKPTDAVADTDGWVG